jgi:hypothetical protein
MATDKSEARVGVILKVGFLSVALLMATHAVLTAYFDDIARAEEHRKFGDVKPEALMSLRADESARLSSGPVPIAMAMHEIATRGRAGASPDIVPTSSKDLAPLQGWVQMPLVVPPAMTAPHEEPVAPEPPAGTLAAGDAGARLADGGAPKMVKPGRTLPDGGLLLNPSPKRP